MPLEVKVLPVDESAEKRDLVNEVFHSFYRRTLSAWGNFCENRIATSVTFAVSIIIVVVLAITA